MKLAGGNVIGRKMNKRPVPELVEGPAFFLRKKTDSSRSESLEIVHPPGNPREDHLANRNNNKPSNNGRQNPEK